VIMNTLAECKRAKEIEDARKRMIAILEMEGV